MGKSEDASTEYKEAGGARDGIFNDNDKRKEDNKDEEDDKENKGEDRGNNPDNEEDAELALLHREMDALEHHMYSKGTVYRGISVCTHGHPGLAGRKNLWGQCRCSHGGHFLRGMKTPTHVR